MQTAITMGKKVSSKELGLVAGLALGKFFFKTEDLHFGLWTDDLEPVVDNFKAAQENYSRHLIDHIPTGVKTILDVGSGGGNLAAALLAKGYSVDCVSPSEHLSRRIEEKLGNRGELFKCKYEQLETSRRYDLILFSESFQYVKIPAALQKCLELLNDEGHILICDFFKLDSGRQSIQGGGHSLAKFQAHIAEVPVTKRLDIDITERTAPTIELWDAFLRDVGLPVRGLTVEYFRTRFPWITRLLGWLLRQRLARIDREYFSGASLHQDFLANKTYRLLIYQKTA
ncbi:MAG: methyltransferase domain-containing protein [Candidatus Marinimicrobia bacterium]|nr:methyltransferase domain-containing protein [Candidatus Neomarinimicrobiota bacterium]